MSPPPLHLQDELYMDGVACLADILTQRKFYTKAEMLARKALEEKIKVHRGLPGDG
jgi:hypothetical protein